MLRKDEVTNSRKHVPIPRSKERNAPITSQFYAYVSRNASSMETDSTRSLLRGTLFARRWRDVSRWPRMVTRYLVSISAGLDATQRRISERKGTGNSDG